MRGRIVPLVMVVLLVILQYQLWSGRGSIPDVARQRSELDAAIAANAKAAASNERLASEVRDLQEGLEMVEERARTELGMVKPNEVFIQSAK